MSKVFHLILFLAVFISIIGLAQGFNNPGHDSLYIDRSGDNVSGTFNFTGTFYVPPPGSPLEAATRQYVDDNAGSDSLWTNTSGNATFTTGNVGIGTSSPDEMLTVNGTSKIVANGVEELESLNIPGSNTISDIHIVGDMLYGSAMGGDGFFILDISDESNPKFLGSAGIGNGARGVRVSGDYAFVVRQQDSDMLRIIDISNPNNPVVVNTVNSPYLNGSRSIRIQGGYAYVAGIEHDGLTVVDISNPVEAEVVGWTSDGVSMPQEVAVDGDYAYLAGYSDSAIFVYDVSNPENPVLVDNLTSPTFDGAAELQIRGSRGFIVAENNASFSMLNTSNPESISIRSTIQHPDLSGANGFEILDEYAYITTWGSDAVVTVDISNPDDMQIIDTYSSPSLSTLYGIRSSGTNLYVVNMNNDAITVFETQGLKTPTLTSGNIRANTASILNDLSVRGETILQGGIDVSHGINARGLSSFETLTSQEICLGGVCQTVWPEGGSQFWNQSGDDIYYDGGRVGVGTDSFRDLFTLEGGFTQVFGEMSVLGSVSNASLMEGAEDVVVKGDYAYVASVHSSSLSIVDVGDPSNLALVGSVNTGAAIAVEVRGDIAYVGGGNTVSVVDVGDKTNPVVLGSISDDDIDAILDIDVSGNFLYTSSSSTQAVGVVDVSDPTNPFLVDFITSSSSLNGAAGIKVQGDFAYVSAFSNRALTVVDVSDSSNLSIVASVSNSTIMNFARAVDVDGRYAYVVGQNSDSLVIVDVLDPFNPVIVGSVISSSLGNPMHVEVRGSYAFVPSEDSQTVSVVDVSNVSNPEIVQTITDSFIDEPRGLFVDGDKIYVAVYGSTGLVSLQGTGINAPGVTTGSLRAGNAIIDKTLFVNQLSVDSGVNVGRQGIFSLGNIHSEGLLSANNFVTTGSNTFVGVNANFDSDLSGTTTLGYAAGDGFQHNLSTAIGSFSLGDGSSGEGATAVGYGAGYDTSADDAVYVGRLAGFGSSGDQAVYIGIGAGQNSGGNSNIGIGPLAVDSTSSGNIIGIGRTAGRFVGGGGDSFFAGEWAGRNSEGGNSMMVGNRAGLNSEGINRIGLGRNALRSSEANNTFAFGRDAGRDAISHNSMFFGFGAGEGWTEDSTLMFYQTDIQDRPLLIGDFESGRIGINTYSAQTELDVNGTVTADSFVGDGSQLTGIDGGLWNQSGSDIYYDEGNVGIGLSSPNRALDVSGDVRASSSLQSGEYRLHNSNGLFRDNSNMAGVRIGAQVGGGARPLIFESGDGGSYNDGRIEFNVDGVTRGVVDDSGVEIDGGLRLNTSNAKPACGSDSEGMLWYDGRSSGEDGVLWNCMINSTDEFNWIMVSRGG